MSKRFLPNTRLEQLGIALEAPKLPVGNYVGCRKVGQLLFVSGRVSELRGKVGQEVTKAQAKEAAGKTILTILSIIKNEIDDLDKIIGVIKLQGFVCCADDFTDLPNVLDGASDLLIQIFGEEGRHARTATGVAQLPFGATLQLDLILEVE